VLAYFFRDPKSFALFNLETLTVLAYSFGDSKCFDLFFRDSNFPDYSFRDSKGFAL